MADYDVIIIGGGINGLTCAAYLAKAGLKTLVLEARGQCGTHCDTSEPGIPGFLHNLHATWLISAMSPAMTDLELEKFGLEWRGTRYAFGKTFGDGTNVLIGNNPVDTLSNWQKHSEADAALLEKAMSFMLPRLADLTETMHAWIYTAPDLAKERALGTLFEDFLRSLGLSIPFEHLLKMNGFEILDLMYRSEHIKTTIQALSWLAGFPPIHPRVGTLGAAVFGNFTGPLFPVHTPRGGSHGLTHALVKAALSYGVTILPCCPVKRIQVRNNTAEAVILSEDAVYANEIFTARRIVSNLTVVPTFIQLVGEELLPGDLARRIKGFCYDSQNIIVVNYALDQAPQFHSAGFDPGIQKTFMGYFGGDTTQAMRGIMQNIHKKIIHDEIIVNWFVPTLADPSQAPAGCHVVNTWLDVPPEPQAWKNKTFSGGFSVWDDLKYSLAQEIDAAWERYAPGFSGHIQERIIYSPLDQFRNNPSAVLGTWAGGSMTPEQFYEKRPVPGVLRNGGSRTFINNLYLSNSIHVYGNSLLSSGYMTACEVAEDAGVREHAWWRARAFNWYMQNAARIVAEG